MEEEGAINSQSEAGQNDVDVEDSKGWFYWYWCSSSKATLKEAAKTLLSFVSTPYKGFYVNIGASPEMGAAEDLQIWTLSFNVDSGNVPLILLHGLVSGSALWALNFDDLCKDRPLYAIDLLGFGQSSRPNFSSDALEAENQFVESIEKWRGAMKLEKFILLGHSLGGFLATSYSIRFPERVKHLILADPWGFVDPPPDLTHFPVHIRLLVRVLEPLNLAPLGPLRLTGPLGPFMVRVFRRSLIKNFEGTLENAYSKVASYIFHCNARLPTGEVAFNKMMIHFGWAKNPINNRVHFLREDMPMTLMYGGRSLVAHYSPEEIRRKRPSSHVGHYVLSESGHHVYADQKKEFAEIVLKAVKI